MLVFTDLTLHDLVTAIGTKFESEASEAKGQYRIKYNYEGAQQALKEGCAVFFKDQEFFNQWKVVEQASVKKVLAVEELQDLEEIYIVFVEYPDAEDYMYLHVVIPDDYGKFKE